MNAKRLRIVALVLIAAAVVASIALVLRGDSSSFSFGQPGNVASVLSEDGTCLYVSYYFDNYIVEVDTSTMQALRYLPITWPTVMRLSPDGEYLYAISVGTPSHLVQIRLSDGVTSLLEVEGEAKDFALDSTCETAWVVHRTWPQSGDVFTDPGADAPPNTGRLTKIDLISFSPVLTQTIESVPISVWFSDYGEVPRLYVLHETYRYEAVFHSLGSAGGHEVGWNETTACWDPVTTYDPDSLRLEMEEYRGGGHNFDFLAARLSNWSDDGRFLAIPSAANGQPAFSLSILDRANPATQNDLVFEDYRGNVMGGKYVHKVPEINTAWAAVSIGFTSPELGAQKAILVRVDTVSNDFDIFNVDEAASFWGDFAVSADGNTLYLTQPKTGEVLVWSPE